MAVRVPADHRHPAHPVARGHRQPLRPGLGGAGHAPQGVGLAGRHRRQRRCCSPCSSGSRSRPRRARPCTARPVARSSSSSRACTAGGDGTRTAAAVTERPRSSRAGRPGASGPCSSASAVVGVAVLTPIFRALGSYDPVWADAVDLRRLDARHLRDGPWLGRLLAVLDRRRRRGRSRCCCARTSTPRPSCTRSTAPSCSGASWSGCGSRAATRRCRA